MILIFFCPAVFAGEIDGSGTEKKNSRLDAQGLLPKAPNAKERARLGATLLIKAAEKGDLDAIKLLLKQNIDVNSKDAGNRTALMAAIERYQEEAVRLLLANGADVNATDEDGLTALDKARDDKFGPIAHILRGAGGKTSEDLALAKCDGRALRRGDELFFRLANGKIVSRKNSPEQEADGYTDVIGRTNVHYRLADFIDPWYVIREGYMEGAGLDLLNKDSGKSDGVYGTALFSPDKTRFLAIGYPGESPCDTEIWKITKSGAIREYVLEHSCANSFGWSDSATVELRDSVDLTDYTVVGRIKWNVNKGKWFAYPGDPGGMQFESRTAGATDDPDEKALIKAASEGDLKSVKTLLKKGVKTSAKDDSHATAMVNASGAGHVEIVKLLLGHRAGTDPAESAEALKYAARAGRKDVIDLLVSRGAKITLQVAASVGDQEAVKRLIREGADVNPEDNDHQTPFFCAVSRNQWDTAITLLENGAKIEDTFGLFGPLLVAAAKDGHIGMIKWLVEKEKVKPEALRASLEAASGEGKQEIVEFLLDRGADINAADNNGRTPLMAAAIRGRHDIVKVLTAWGADVNAQDADGATALMDAAWAGNPQVVELLLSKGARIPDKHIYGGTAEMMSAGEEIKKLLR